MITMSGFAMVAFLLPLRNNTNRKRSTWLQYCQQCLAATKRRISSSSGDCHLGYPASCIVVAFAINATVAAIVRL